MRLIDTHAHLYLDQFKDDIDETIHRAISNGVEQIYLPNIDSTTIKSLHNLESNYPETCIAMMGLHPCSVKENYKEELKIIHNWLLKRTYCAVGEIGIDLYWDKTYYKEQIEAFEYQINLAKDLKIPFVIHSRDSLDETIDVVTKLQGGDLKGIFHCFNGNVDQGKKIIDVGFYLGIGGVLTYKNSGLAETIANIPLSSLVLETDAPYLSPVPYRGKRNESSYILDIAEKLAEVKKENVKQIAEVTTENAEKLFIQHAKNQKKPIIQ